MNPLDQFRIQATQIGQGPLGLGGLRNSGGTGEVQGDPNDFMQKMLAMVRRIHGYRQTMGNYASSGGTNDVNQS